MGKIRGVSKISDYYIQGGEFKHYGIPGMKWGIRRTPAQLSRARDKLETKNAGLRKNVKNLKALDSKYTAKSESYKSNNSKYEARIADASAKKAKYDYKLSKAIAKSKPKAKKVAKLTAKSARYQNEITKNRAKLKFNKWQVKADSVREESRQAQEKIQKNEHLMSVYSKTISAIDDGTIRQGKYFMRYVDDE